MFSSKAVWKEKVTFLKKITYNEHYCYIHMKPMVVCIYTDSVTNTLHLCQESTTDLLLSIVQFVGSLYSWVKDGLRCPHFDLQQAHVDPEHSRASQWIGALDFALDILLQAGKAGFHQAIRE